MAPLSDSEERSRIVSRRADPEELAETKYARSAELVESITGMQPTKVFEPESEAELVDILRSADAAGLSVLPRGGGTKTGWGNPPERADMILSTARLDQVIEHAWADLTVSVEAGCTIQKLQNTLAEHGQYIAVDPLWPDQATVGGILSTNDSGTLRIKYGALRDLIIGVTIALPDGTLATSGGKVVKNVAGYDLPKLVTGALGTLGIITRAIFRLHPVPRQVRSFTISAQDLDQADRLLLAVRDSKLAYTGLQMRLTGQTAPAIDVRFEGTITGLAAQEMALRTLATSASLTTASESLWRARQELWLPPESAAIAKFSVLPATVAKTCGRFRQLADSLNVQWSTVAQGTGLGLLRLEGPSSSAIHKLLLTLRHEIESAGGSVVILHRSKAVPAMDAWGGSGDALRLMQSVKHYFDPRRTLNPGRFVGGI